jgi:hypothetical protein
MLTRLISIEFSLSFYTIFFSPSPLKPCGYSTCLIMIQHVSFSPILYTTTLHGSHPTSTPLHSSVLTSHPTSIPMHGSNPTSTRNIRIRKNQIAMKFSNFGSISCVLNENQNVSTFSTEAQNRPQISRESRLCGSF